MFHKAVFKKYFSPINNAKVSDTLMNSRSNVKICKCRHDYWNDSESNSVFSFLYKCLTSWFISDRCLIMTFLGLPRPKMRSKRPLWQHFLKERLPLLKNVKHYSISKSRIKTNGNSMRSKIKMNPGMYKKVDNMNSKTTLNYVIPITHI